ncbi:uncharacterized protein [Nicotiana sylvestris]|uniref:uncharacterized protein n=1 Tax=Nicotiana sylvestris TaxID=4096 RepID=UPI00388CB26F
MIGVTDGTPFSGGGFIANIFDGMTDGADLDVFWCHQKGKEVPACKEAYDHAILRLHEELSGWEKERDTIASKLQDSEARGARGDKELGELRVSLEVALREKDALVEQSSSQISQLEVEISGLKERGEAEAKHAKAKAKKEVLEGLETRGFELSTDPAEARETEVKLVLLIVPDGGEDDSGAESSLEVRLDSPKEEGRLLAQVSRSIGERKDVPWCEKACSEAFDRLKTTLLCCEALLREAQEMGRSLELLCAAKENELVFRVQETLLEIQWKDKVHELEKLWGEVGVAKCDFDELQAHVSAHSKAKERAQAATSALEDKIQAVHASDSAQAKMITRLSSELSRAKTEVVNIRAEVVINNTRAGRDMASHSRSAAAARAELKKALDREKNSREYERCRSRRETLEEIHARGFDLSKEIEQAKGENFDAKFLISDEEETVRP